MKASEVARLSNDALRRGLLDLIAQDRTTTVRLLIHLGEFDARRLYREEAYSCMKDYCMGQLAMSEDIAYKRIWVARRARRFPRILVALNDGSLTLSAVAMLARYLTSANADELLSAAKGKTNALVAELIAQRFPRPDLPTLVQSASSPHVAWQALPSAQAAVPNCQALAVRQVDSVEVSPSGSRVMPLAPERHGVQFTIGKSDLDLLRRAQDLLSHQSPSPDAGEIFVRALRAFVVRLERTRFGAPECHRKAARRGENGRYIPMHVRRAVRERDADRCTFVAENGRRCEARRLLEFDHVKPVARGGKSTSGNLRLRCRAHNQYEAEQAYGREFMQAKVEASRATEARKRADEVVPWLQALGIRADRARQAAESCDVPNATLEERVKRALSSFAPRDVALRRAQSARCVETTSQA
jgi:5-methylcytosine-specific restriction endonuclease McrA